MTAKEALEALMLGKKVRRPEWVKEAYIYYDRENLKLKNNETILPIWFDDYFNKNQWELYEEDERRNTMNFEEARKALLEGKKVRYTKWNDDIYVYFDDKNLLVKQKNGEIQRRGIYDMGEKGEWELYEEPKKLIKVFISQPMNARFKYDIEREREKIKKLVEAKYGKVYQIEYLNEDSRERPKNWTRIQHLGYSIMNMHDADIVVFAPDWIKAAGCCAEHEVAYRYDKKIYTCEKEVDGEYHLY